MLPVPAPTILFPSAAGGGFAGPLDAYEAELFGAWSAARRLLAAYTGDLVRLRRSSDSAESDFGFDADGELDVAAITTWKGAASLYLVTLYDQKGANNMTQATAGSQPPFNLTGGGGTSKPHYDGGGTKFPETAIFTNYSGADHTWGVAGSPAGAFNNCFLAKNAGGSRNDFIGANTPVNFSAVRINGNYVVKDITDTGWRVTTVRKSGNGSSNVRLLSKDLSATGTIAVNMDIDCYRSGTRPTAECFAAHSALSTAAQDAIHAEMRTYFGL